MKKPHGRYVLIGSAEELAPQDMLRERPQHVEVIPAFMPIPDQEPEMHHRIQKQVDYYHHLDVVVGEASWAGPNNNTPVRRVASDSLSTLHRDILAELADISIDINPRTTGRNYAPYVLESAVKPVQFGQIITMKALYLVTKFRRHNDEGKLFVSHVYPFGAARDKN